MMQLPVDVLEVDVCFTADGVPVLTHNFEPDGELAFPKGRPDVEQFLSTKINGQWTPLTFEMFIELIRGWSGVVFVDSHGEAQNLMRWISERELERKLSRWIFQIDQEEDLSSVRRLGFSNVHFVGHLLNVKQHIPWLVQNGIHTVSIPHREILGNLDLKPFTDAGIHVFAFTLNHKSDQQRVLAAGASGYFTDWLFGEE